MISLTHAFPGGSAVVTGGASGLGLAAARALTGAGLSVSVLDLPQACERLDAGEGLFSIPADVTDAASVEAAFAKHEAQSGACRVHVNCAGVIGAGMMFARENPLTGDAFRRVIDVNLIGSFNCARAAALQMKAADPTDDGARGIIINTSSIAAYDGMIGQTAYAASKGAIASMTLPMARELAHYGIRVMTIAPGVFSTPMIHNLPGQSRDMVSSMLPVFPQRLGEPDEFGLLVLSIIANPLLNGEVIRLDGGLRMPPR